MRLLTGSLHTYMKATITYMHIYVLPSSQEVVIRPGTCYMTRYSALYNKEMAGLWQGRRQSQLTTYHAITADVEFCHVNRIRAIQSD